METHNDNVSCLPLVVLCMYLVPWEPLGHMLGNLEVSAFLPLIVDPRSELVPLRWIWMCGRDSGRKLVPDSVCSISATAPSYCSSIKQLSSVPCRDM